MTLDDFQCYLQPVRWAISAIAKLFVFFKTRLIATAETLLCSIELSLRRLQSDLTELNYTDTV